MMHDSMESDRFIISHYDYLQKMGEISQRSYQRGMKQLLEKEFIFRTPAEGVFFVNIQYMFNGDRLAFIKGYKRKQEG
jgi:hypothetical protein